MRSVTNKTIQLVIVFRLLAILNGGQAKEKSILEILMEVARAAATIMATGYGAAVGE